MLQRMGHSVRGTALAAPPLLVIEAIENKAADRHRPIQADRSREILWTVLFCLCAALALAHFVHTAFVVRFGVPAPPPPTGDLRALYAPEAYRLAMPLLLRELWNLVPHADLFLLSAGVDFACSFAALLIYSWILRDSDTELSQNAGQRADRLFRLAVFFAAVQFPLAWVVPWQRPETTPTALFIAVALLCMDRRRSGPGWTTLLVLITVWQSFVRSDVPAVLALSVLLVSVFPASLDELGTRRLLFLRGAAMLAIAIGIQAWLELRLVPHRHYAPGTNMVQWRDNLQFHNIETAAVALLPFLFVAAFGVFADIRLCALDRLILTASAIYLVMWYAVGNLAEVRIFVPFLLALCLVAARLLTRWLFTEGSSTPDLLH